MEAARLDLLISILREQKEKLLNMMDRFKEYSPGLSKDIKMSTTNEFLEGIEDSISKVINSRECQEIITEIRKYQSSLDLPPGIFTYPHHSIEPILVLLSASDYLEKEYEKEKIFQRDKVRKIITIARLFYALLIQLHLYGLRRELETIYKLPEKLEVMYESTKKIEINLSDLYPWRDVYEIGLLQGELNLISSHLDPEIRDIHFRHKSHESISKRWDPRKKVLEEAAKLAREIWEKGDLSFHDEMADHLHGILEKKYPDFWFVKSTIREAIKPVAREYNRLRGVKKEK